MIGENKGTPMLFGLPPWRHRHRARVRTVEEEAT